jgi:hypothetical protein
MGIKAAEIVRTAAQTMAAAETAPDGERGDPLSRRSGEPNLKIQQRCESGANGRKCEDLKEADR